jgi:signal transduction histidine kinase
LTHSGQAKLQAALHDRFVARTACDIAHDFANVLTVIRGSADLMRPHIDGEHPAAEELARILQAVQEAAALTGELRSIVCEERSTELPWP